MLAWPYVGGCRDERVAPIAPPPLPSQPKAWLPLPLDRGAGLLLPGRSFSRQRRVEACCHGGLVPHHLSMILAAPSKTTPPEQRQHWPAVLACFATATFAWGFGFYGQPV